MSPFKTRWLPFYFQHRKDGLPPSQAIRTAKHDARYTRGVKTYLMDDTTDLPNGWAIKVETERDDYREAPWEDSDCHGVVTEWQSRQDYMDDWALSIDRWGYRYYDWKASLEIALKEGWDAKPYGQGTKQDQAMRAIKADYEYLRRWCNDDWEYVNLTVTLLDEEGEEIDSDSCCGYESDADASMCSEARSWAARMIRKARQGRRQAAKNAKISRRFADAMECGI